jgi:DNA end-binding protein Ku
VLRNREHLAAIKPVGKALILEQMRFPDEVRDPAGLNLPEAKAGKQEVDLALTLIEQLSGGFAPEDYHDTYTQQLEEVIEAKAKGRKPKKTAGKEPAPTKVNDLVAALRASLDEHNEVKSRTRR